MSNSDTLLDNKWAKNAFGEAVRKSGGKFTQEESETVKQAVQEYCATKQISVTRLCSECEHKSELKGSWMEIAKVLPHRSVQSVYRHGLRILHPFKRGAWEEEECAKLVYLVASHGKKWALIQNKMNRSADSCRDKYREMGDDYVKGKWKSDEIERLKKLIREYLRADPNASMVDLAKMVEAEGITIPWSSISKKMGSRSRLSCFKKYQKMVGAFPPSDARHKPTKKKGSSSAAAAASGNDQESHAQQESNPGDVDIDLLSELVATGATRSSEVQWDALRTEDAQTRWYALVGEWQQQEGSEATEETLTTLPLCELAQVLLDRKSSAKMAAETVEAVDLPNPSTLLG